MAMTDAPESPERPETAAPVAGLLAELKACTGLLTRLPVTVPAGADIANAARFFPVVGFGVGAAGAVVLAGALWLGLPDAAAALLGLATMTVFTGALHEDGLADTCDGLGGRGGKEVILSVMRDSHMGAFGVLGLVFAISLRWAGLTAAAAAGAGPAVLAIVAGATVSRGLLPAVMHFTPPAREDGLSAGAGQPAFDRMVASALIGLAVSVACLGFQFGLFAFVAAAAIAWGMTRLAVRHIGGQTGDVLGAIQQVTEIAVLLTAAASLA